MGLDPDAGLAGRQVLVRPHALLRFVGRRGTEYALPAAEAAPTLGGATLTVFDTGPFPSAGVVTLNLPAPRWTALGSPPGSKGYRYAGSGGPGDPCTVVTLKPSGVRASCAGPDIALRAPFSGDVGVRLTIAGSRRYCARLGGLEVANRPDLVKRRSAPIPAACP